MSTFLSGLTNIVLPILLVAGIGYVLRRAEIVTDARPLARLTLYLFSPALVLDSIARSRLESGDLVALILFAVLIAVLTGVLALGVARVFRFDRLIASAFLLSIMFVNGGNFGLPFNQFAYGAEGLSRAAVYFVGSSIMAQTVAVFVASSGRNSIRESILAVFKMPLVYALVIGMVLNRTGWVLPEAIGKSISIAGAGAVPVMLVMLGIELARVRLFQLPGPALLASALKLLVAPAVAFGLATLMGLHGLTRSVAVIQASMPTAVMASLIAVEFDTRPEFVSSVVLVTTLGSMLTLVLLLILLGYSG